MKTSLPPGFLQPSAAFRRQAVWVISGIIGFIVIYLLMVVASLAILAASVAAGIFVIYVKVAWITILLGLGLIGFGFMVVAFLIKFIFSSTVDVDPHRVEITREQEPKLFDYIESIAAEVGTDKPKKIFLTPDVNAAVFYNSSFFSLFVPVKKNLQIGLGLVNSLNKGEFKAVIAHEFGHFSQRSMKLGTYVYTTNKVIYNLLYENAGWSSTLQSFANIHAITSIFAHLTVAIAKVIIYILSKVYGWIQLVYMALSREMEYHADLVAVSVAGSAQMVSALRRVQFASQAYSFADSQLNKLSGSKSRCENFYEIQSRSILHLSQLNHITLSDGLPVITDAAVTKALETSDIEIKDQWASHPSLRDRETNITRQYIDMPADTSSTWTLFSDPLRTQQMMSAHSYSLSTPDYKSYAIVSADQLFDTIQSTEQAITLPERLEAYFADRRFEKDVLPDGSYLFSTSFNEVFTEEYKQDIAALSRLADDQQKLRHICSESSGIRTFDYKGVKYRRKDAPNLLLNFNNEILLLKKKVYEHDRRAFSFFHAKAETLGRTSDLLRAEDFFFAIQAILAELADIRDELVGVYIRLQAKASWQEEELIPIYEEVSDQKIRLEKILETAKSMHPCPFDLPAEMANVKRYLLDERLADVATRRFDYSWFSKLYGQVAGSTNRSLEIWQRALSHLLRAADEVAGS